jgi:hypothetical protein
MIRVGPRDASCKLRTRRQGLLAAVGHDLVLEVADFQLTFWLEEGRAVGVFQAESVRVLGVLVDGDLDTGRLSPSDRATIERHARDDVLRARRHPEIVCEAKGLAFDDMPEAVVGSLDLCGVTRNLGFRTSLEDGQWIGRTVIHQPDHGISPFRAMLGALNMHADVEVKIAVEDHHLSGLRSLP